MGQAQRYEKPLDQLRRKNEEEYFKKQDQECLRKIKVRLNTEEDASKNGSSSKKS